MEIITDIIGSNSGIDTNIEKQVVVSAVISLSSPVENQLNRFHLFVLKSDVINLDLDNPCGGVKCPQYQKPGFNTINFTLYRRLRPFKKTNFPFNQRR